MTLVKITPIASLLAQKVKYVDESASLILPKLAWIPTDQLLLDQSYQRDISRIGETTIKRIISDFDWLQFGALVVARMPGGYAVIDGQHRAVAALHLMLPQVPALIGNAILTGQADAFVGINKNRTRVGPIDEYRAKLVSGDRNALELQSVLDRLEIKIEGPTGNALRPRHTRAINKLQTLAAKIGHDQLAAILELMITAQPDTTNLLTATNIEATALVFRRIETEGHTTDRLQETLADILFDEVEDNARNLVKMLGGQKMRHAAGQIAKAYNKNHSKRISEAF